MPPKDVFRLKDYWASGAKYELKSAASLMRSKQWMSAMFHCHLSVEKALKALYVHEHKIHAPLLHSLPYLAGKLSIDFGKGQMAWLENMNQYNIEGRYPEDIEELEAKLSPDLAQRALADSKEIVTWLLQALKKS